MQDRKKILILENDDFLREILGNLLYKNEGYIFNAPDIARGVTNNLKKQIDIVILGTSCDDFDGKSTISHINKELNNPDIFVINAEKNALSYVAKKDQMMVSNLSIEKIIKRVLK